MDDLEDTDLKNRQKNQLKEIHNKTLKNQYRIRDKSDHGTVENCIDARVRRILEKLKKSGEITSLSGCVATGKEANVYYAKGRGFPDGENIEREIAVKIYKTSILIFKDRERYITGEFRFRNGYCKSNPRKMVAVWCEKEIRNLKRLRQKNILCPEPYLCKSTLILMEFIGENEEVAPRLKDALPLFENEEEFLDCYIKIIEIMSKIYKECKLVHSDFSEYNLLYFKKQIYVIDVAQAVELNHPNSDYFLKRDCHNINDFFNKNKLDTITDEQLYYFVVDKQKLSCKEYVLQKQEENKKELEKDPKYKINSDNLFSQYEVPHNLIINEDDSLITNEMDFDLAMINLVKKQKKIDEKSDSDDSEENEESDEEEEEDEENNNNNNENDDDDKNKIKEKKEKFDPFKGMTKEERKKKVKEDNKERRANKKFTKKEKKKIIKKTTTHNKK